jgi:hypothetical protein
MSKYAAKAEKAGKTAPKKARRVNKNNARISTALLSNTIQKTRGGQQKDLEAIYDDQSSYRALRAANIDEVGANLSASGCRAMIAIARIAHHRGYYSEADKLRRSGSLDAPGDILITQKEFFNAYGIKRTRNSKGDMDYDSSATRDALQGLYELSRPVLQVYSKKASSGKAGRRDVIRTIAPLVTTKELYLDVTTKREREIIEGDTSGRGLKHLRVSPSEIFYMSSFMNLPDNLYHQLEDIGGKRTLTPALYKQVIVLALHVHHNPEDKTFRRQLDKFLANTGKNKLLESRQKNRAISETSKELVKLQKVGAVKNHRVIKDRAKGDVIEIDVVPEAFQ